MAWISAGRQASVKVYNGYGHTNDLIVYGHVFGKRPAERKHFSNSVLTNVFHLLRLFFVKPLPDARVQLKWNDQVIESVTETDGFFKFEWKSEEQVPAGWHPVEVSFLRADGSVITTGEGKIFVPHITQYAFISDIDDTVLISHSATIGKRLQVLFTKNPHTRKSFDDIVEHYKLLALAHTDGDVSNPFFYVSSSEWNLYDDLNEFFRFNGLPEGSFLLSQIKKWFELVKTGKTKHEGKLLRVLRILKAFPNQEFILFGDNSQSDPVIYATIVKKYPERIHAVYIRNIRPENEHAVRDIFAELSGYNVHTCIFNNSQDAIAHSKEIGLI
jgi:phosphatidate phosphatase APP1